MKKILSILVFIPLVTFSQTKYEVIPEKAYFFSPTELTYQDAYLVKGDIALCSESIINSIEYEYTTEDFCFCWFKHHSGRVTTGYIMEYDLTLKDITNSTKWHSLKNLNIVDYKTDFFRPKSVYKENAYLIQGDIAICDDVINIEGREYRYCEFKKPSGSNKGRVTVGYLENRKLRIW